MTFTWIGLLGSWLVSNKLVPFLDAYCDTGLRNFARMSTGTSDVFVSRRDDTVLLKFVNMGSALRYRCSNIARNQTFKGFLTRSAGIFRYG